MNIPLPPPRYDVVNFLWAGSEVPAITRAEAERAARKLYAKFGRRNQDFPAQRKPAKFTRVRACWVTRQPEPSLNRGWARLVHDVSHDLFRSRYPMLRPHHPLHASLELQITRYVLDAGWLTGALRKPAPTKADVQRRELARVDGAIVRWEAKRRRAEVALTKLGRKRARLESQLGVYPGIPLPGA